MIKCTNFDSTKTITNWTSCRVDNATCNANGGPAQQSGGPASCPTEYWSLRTPYVDCAPVHSSCTHCAPARAGRCRFLHPPCTRCAAARTGRRLQLPLHTPCTDCGPARASRRLPFHTPCTDCGSARSDSYSAVDAVLPRSPHQHLFLLLVYLVRLIVNRCVWQVSHLLW